MSDGFPQVLSSINNTGVDFLLTDLDTALTFMDVAQASQIQETVSRNHENARKAYDTVVRLLPKLRPDTEQRKAIDDKLALLKARRERVGISLDSLPAGDERT